MSFTQLTEEAGLMYGISKGWSLFWTNGRQAFELKAIVAVTFLVLSCCIIRAILLYSLQKRSRGISQNQIHGQKHVIAFIETFIKVRFASISLFQYVGAATAYLYFTLEEIDSAANLKLSIERMGIRNQKGKRK